MMRYEFGLPDSMIQTRRAEEVLAAVAASVQQNPQFAGLRLGDLNSRFQNPHSLSHWGGSYDLTTLRLGHELNLDLQRQALSLAAPSQQQQGGASSMSVSLMQQHQQSLQLRKMVLESLLARQDEARLLMDKSFPPSQTTWSDSVQTQAPQAVKVIKALTKPPRQKATAKTFPIKLMEAITAHYDEDIVSWLPDGRSFAVVNPDLFDDVILKTTFKNCKYASFVRKLNRWGFSRHTSGADCFYHPLFQYDRMDLCAQIVCLPRNERSRKKQVPSDASTGVDPRLARQANNLSRGDFPSLAGIEKFSYAKHGM